MAKESITIEIDVNHAMALAQMAKRFTFQDAERLANEHDGGQERDAMIEGVLALSRGLSGAGYSPR